jgi:DNA (cytosine-5)-methyltransferase 1
VKFIDMFAGIGGFRSGLEQAGHKCIGYIEWDKFARQSYQAMYDTKGEFTANDIQQVKGNSLPAADAWTFGSPCTNISIAGNRKGLKGNQSRMFFEVIRLLKERAENQKTLPAYLIMENVKNLLSSNEGRDFAEVLTQMDSVGYDAEWSVFNSSDVVPQNRERVYIIGHLRGAGTGQVFPIQRQGSDSSQSNGIRVVGNLSKTGYKSCDVLDEKGIAKTLTATDYKHPTLVRVSPRKDLRKFNLKKSDVSNTVTTVQKDNLIGTVKTHKIKIVGNVSKTGHHSDDVMDEYGISKAITAQNAYKHTPKVAVHQIGNIIKTKSFGGNPQRGRVYDMDGLSPTLNTMQGGGLEPKIAVRACLTPDRVKKRQNGRRFKENGEPAFTVTVADRNGVMLKNGDVVVIRKLTPRECWRLQGFSDEQFDKAKNAGVSNSQLYKQAGNAVTVPVVRAIGEKLAENEAKMMRESKLTKDHDN